ncbi:MAG: Lrp/AsnC family transcriptional regulator [Janthinobacterium lividum]
MARQELDHLDREVLRELEQDGRRAFREIARNLETSEATVRQRVRRLQELDILRIVAFADPEKLGQSQLGLVFVKLELGTHDAVVEALVALPEVTYVSTLLGRADLCVEVMCRDNNELWDLLATIAAIPGIRETESSLILRVHKLRYRTPTP